MESWSKVKLGQVEIGSNIAQNHSSNLYEVLSDHFIYPNHMKSWPKAKLSQVGLGLNIAQNHFSSR